MTVTKCLSLSCVWLFVTPWTVAHQAPLFMEFSRQEYWSGLPFLSPGDLPKPGIEHCSSALQADSLPTEAPGKQDTGGRQQIILLCLLQASSLCYLGHGQWVTKFGGLSPERCFIQGTRFSSVSSASLSKKSGKFLVPFLNKEPDNKPRWEKKLYLCVIPFYRECNCGWVFTCWGICFHFLLNLYPEIDFLKCFFPSVYQIGKYENT